MMEGSNKDAISIVEANAEIMHMISAMATMGATDNSEKEKLEAISRELLAGNLIPSKALEEARKIFNSRQDYH